MSAPDQTDKQAEAGGPEDFGPPVELIGEAAIRERVASLAEEIAADYADRNPHLLVVLRGAFVFAADLARRLDFPLTVDFCRADTYGAAVLPSAPRVDLYRPETLAGREVLIVEDIVDTGLSLAALSKALQPHGPASVRCVVLLDKPARRWKMVEPEYTGFVIPDRFVVGYGLDHAGRYRQLPYVGALTPPAGEDGSSGGS